MSEKVKLTLVSCILTLGLIITYSNHFDNAFHFDDSHTIVDNIFIRDIKNIPLFFQDAKTTSSLPTNQAYRPVITSLNTIDYWIAKKLDPFYFHLHIFIEYILLCLLLYFTFLKVFERASGKKLKWLSLFGATFFAFHTANAETINYIIARSDEFSTLMTIAGLLIFISSDGWKKQLGLIPFFIGCLAKPTTLMLAPILVVYDLLFEHPSILIKAEKARFVKRVSSSILITLPYFISGFILYFFTRSMFSDTWVPSNVKMVHYLNTQPYVFWIYLKTFFLPIDLTADTDLHLIKDFFDSRVLFGLIVIVAMLFVAIKTSFKRKLLPISFGILWFFVALIPSSSVVPLAEVMNHHRTFFPYIGLIISSTWVLYLLFEYFKKRAVSELRLKYIFMLCSVLFIATHAFGTYQRNIVWDSDESLWLDVTIRSPKNGRGQMNYGLTKMRKGKYLEAIKYFENARKTTYGNHPYLFINFGVAKNALGLKSEAENYFRLAVQKGPGYPDCQYYYGKWLMENGRSSEAIPYLQKAVQLSPAHGYAKKLLAAVSSSAEERLRNSEVRATQQPSAENYLSLSLDYYNNGKFYECIQACEKALQIKPNYPEAYNNICSAYNKLRMWDKAIDACNKALEIRPEYKLAKGNLNWAQSQKQKGN